MLAGFAVAFIVVLLVLLLRQHRIWAAAAEEAVLVKQRTGAFAAAVAEAQGPALEDTVPRAQPMAHGHTAAGRASVSGDKPLWRSSFSTAPDNLAVGAAVGVAGLADWWHVDENVFKAIEALTHEHIGNTIDLWSAVHEHHFHLGEAFFTSLRGHVGEQMAADHLAAAGLQFSWPDASNQPGWDLSVENHLINVKVTGDATRTLAEHFDKYPGIPGLINADAAHIPHDAIAFDPSNGLDPSVLVGEHITLVDHALSLHDAAASVHDAFGAAVDAHVPVVGVLVTVVRSGVREGKLVREGHTDTQRALKNVAIDTAARGGGIMAGGLAGAAAGAHVDAITFGATMGLGTVIGSILGAVGGAMAGSAAASHLRLAPLRDAWQRLQRDLHGYERSVDAQQKIVTAKVAGSEQRAQRELAQWGQAAEGRLTADLARRRLESKEASAFDALRVLEASFADLERRSAAMPNDLVSQRPRAPIWYLRRALRRRIADLRQRANKLAGVAGDGGPEAEEFWDIVACSTNGDAALTAYGEHRVVEQRRAHREAVRRAISEVALLNKARNAARREVLATLQDARSVAVAALEREVDQLKKSVSAFEREALAAGRNISS